MYREVANLLEVGKDRLERLVVDNVPLFTHGLEVDLDHLGHVVGKVLLGVDEFVEGIRSIISFIFFQAKSECCIGVPHRQGALVFGIVGRQLGTIVGNSSGRYGSRGVEIVAHGTLLVDRKFALNSTTV